MLKGAMLCIPGSLFFLAVFVLVRVFSDVPRGKGLWGPSSGFAAAFVLAVGAVMGATAHRTWRAYRQEYHDMLRRLAEALGLKYRQHNERNPLDRFAWAITGEFEGRDVKIARLPESFLGGEVRFLGANVISTPCRPAKPLSALLGRREDHLGQPSHEFPQAHLSGVGAWVKGDFDPEAVGRLEVMEALVMDRMKEAGIEIKEGRAKLYYDLASPVLNYHPPLVQRALRAVIELAELVERPDSTIAEGAQ